MSQVTLSFPPPILPGANMISALLSILSSVVSNRAGTQRPSDVVENEIWLDTTTPTAMALKLWDGAQDIPIGYFNASTHLFTPAAGMFPTADGGGAADAITATFSPAISLADKTICTVVATAANATTTPTFNPNSLGAKTITKQGGQALAVGDIYGAGHTLLLQYKYASTRWELLNPATLVNGAMLDREQNWTRQQRYSNVALTSSGGAVAIDPRIHAKCSLTPTENVVLAAASPQTVGDVVCLTLIGNSGFTIGYNANYKPNALNALPAMPANGKRIDTWWMSDGTYMRLQGVSAEV